MMNKKIIAISVFFLVEIHFSLFYLRNQNANFFTYFTKVFFRIFKKFVAVFIADFFLFLAISEVNIILQNLWFFLSCLY